jgi:hypothetical protein
MMPASFERPSRALTPSTSRWSYSGRGLGSARAAKPGIDSGFPPERVPGRPAPCSRLELPVVGAPRVLPLVGLRGSGRR